VIKRSIRYMVLALSLVALTSATHSASAQSVVGGGDPEPMSTTRIILLILSTVLLP